MTVLVFDSGIGGLTVLREARVLMPDHRFVYVADDAAFPYGNWEEQALRAHMAGLFRQLVERHEPDMIIVACNTASTLILETLRQNFDFPIVGTVPAIKPAAERTSSGYVSVLATPATVQREYTRSLIEQFAAQVNVQLVGAQNLAAQAERFMTTGACDTALVRQDIEPCFVAGESGRTDIVVLACTHYPFLTNVLRRLAPWPVDWLNPAEAVARHARSCLPERGEITEVQDHAYFTGGKPPPPMQRLFSGFGLQLDDSV